MTTKTVTGNAVLYTLEKLGHSGLVDALRSLDRRVAEHGFTLESRITIKADDLTLALKVKQADEAELPLFPAAAQEDQGQLPNT